MNFFKGSKSKIKKKLFFSRGGGGERGGPRVSELFY